MISHQQRWDRKYRAKTHGGNLAPERLLVEYSHLFSSSQLVVDLACGTGRNAIFLAKLGCFVQALDLSNLALRSCLELATKSDVEIHPVMADLNMYRLGAGSVDAIVCFYYLNRELASNIQKALKPGGLFLMKTFNENYLRENPKFNPNYVLAAEELSKLFSSLIPIAKNDSCLPESTTKSYLVARKPS